MNMVIPILTNILFGFITAHFAQKRGRDGVTWFVIGVLLGLFGLVLLFLLPPPSKEETIGPIGKGAALGTDSSQDASAFSGWGGKAKEREKVPNGGKKEAQMVSTELQQYREKDWFYADDKHQPQGPIAYEDLRLALQREHAAGHSLVWCEGMPAWKILEEIPEVYADLTENSQ